jgi:hypothetical protein
MSRETFTTLTNTTSLGTSTWDTSHSSLSNSHLSFIHSYHSTLTNNSNQSTTSSHPSTYASPSSCTDATVPSIITWSPPHRNTYTNVSPYPLPPSLFISSHYYHVKKPSSNRLGSVMSPCEYLPCGTCTINN